MTPEPFVWILFGAVGTFVLESVFRWLRRQEEAAYWQRERVYRERHQA